eukprot:811844-Prymnesium_polylepis.2
MNSAQRVRSGSLVDESKEAAAQAAGRVMRLTQSVRATKNCGEDDDTAIGSQASAAHATTPREEWWYVLGSRFARLDSRQRTLPPLRHRTQRAP